MFSITDSKFDQELQIHHTIPESSFTHDRVMYFDNDGFELTALEQIFYEGQGIPTNNILNHNCDQRVWIKGGNDEFKIDHCLLLQRWEFTGEARWQINEHKQKFPQLLKFLKIIPKWGLDFALDYYSDNDAVEVIHIENDYRSYEEACEAKRQIENQILNTDWDDFTRNIINQKEQWIGLTGFAQNDWKAVYWGMNKAEVTQKAYAGH